MSQTPALSLCNAGYQIQAHWLVRHASVQLPPGSLTAILGPNGAGKTTLLRLLAGLIPPHEGTAHWHQDELQRLSRRELARRIAFVPQDTHVGVPLTVRELVALGRHPHRGRFTRPTPHDAVAIRLAMERTAVGHLAERLVTELSGGERQRVILARSLATEAAALLIDEPTASLDIAHALEVLELCRRLADEGQTIAMVLHDVHAAARFATGIVLMCDGRIVHCGSPEQVLREEILDRVFQVCTRRLQADDGTPVFVFSRPR